ncbi:MAG: DUF4280 domain-containing protein [Lachnospiraceae bacterium]|nr:DUF4280 domain-containing protein [Lachnospiraceae bacterium]
MGQVVTTGAQLMCSFGTTPGNLTATNQQTVLIEGKPAATLSDTAPMVNITPFGMCTSLANPQVAAATAAALGVLTPQPCIPAPAGTWIPSQSTVLAGGTPCLTNDCKLMCSYAGSISIVNPGQVKASIN